MFEKIVIFWMGFKTSYRVTSRSIRAGMDSEHARAAGIKAAIKAAEERELKRFSKGKLIC